MAWIKANIPEETHRAIKIHAAKTDRRIQDVAAEVLEAHFSDYDA